ncbi:MAG: hypothetical protein EOO29_40335, partial [Comamonadaceae bacterium]
MTDSAASSASVMAAAPAALSASAVFPVAQAAVAPLGMTAAGPGAVGFLTQATPGVVIVRGGSRIAAEGTQNLLPGDRVLVPEGGQAAVSFPGTGGNKAPLNGMLTGGTDATISTTRLPGGLE